MSNSVECTHLLHPSNNAPSHCLPPNCCPQCISSQTIPGDISRFENLTTIEADNNELSSLPSALASMPIYRLSLRRNSLSSAASVDEFLAPPSIAPPGSLPLSISIRELDLSSNGLSGVPAAIFACRGLQVGV